MLLASKFLETDRNPKNSSEGPKKKGEKGPIWGTVLPKKEQ